MADRRFTFLALFCGAGGGSLGLQRAGLRCVGAVDADAQCAEDHAYLTGHRCTVADLATMQPHELAAACDERPDVVFTSPPCKGFSGCLPVKSARQGRYQEMNSLAERGIMLALEAWDTPPSLFVMENVPNIMSRGRVWLDRVIAMLHAYGYAVRESTHDCGELGALAQRRRRYLLVARHMQQVPEWLYQPPHHRVRGVGEVLDALPVPLPGESLAGPMHALPRLSALNWVRLALIPAGGDWRDLPESVRLEHSAFRGGHGVRGWDQAGATIRATHGVRTSPGAAADPRLDHSPQGGCHGVTGWAAASPTVTGYARVGHAGVGAVSDPRLDHTPGKSGRYGVESWDDPSHTVTSARSGSGWATSVSDPRLAPRAARQNGGYGVESWGDPGHAVLAAAKVRDTRSSVADPRLRCAQRSTTWGVVDWDAEAGTVTAHASPDNGGWSVTDPRSTCSRREGAFGVLAHDQAAPPVIGHASVHNWPGAREERRLAQPTHVVVDGVIYGPELDIDDRSPTHLIIRAEDGTWHRPLTTLELALLQGFPATVAGLPLVFAGGSHQRWRQAIGNAVPPPSAEAIGRECIRTLEASREGRLLLHGGGGVWVRERPSRHEVAHPHLEADRASLQRAP